MSTTIQDGTGSKVKVKVNSFNRLQTSTIQESIFEHAVERGEAFNVNTENISITTSAESALLYFKNNEDRDIILTGWFIGTGIQGASPTELGLMRVYVNPTGGTLISGATQVNIVNRLIGSANTFQFTVYKGFDGATITGQSSTPILYQTQGTSTRSFGEIYIAIKKGQAIAVTYLPNGAQPIKIYTGFQGFLLDQENT